jgi:hypothetical protein
MTLAFLLSALLNPVHIASVILGASVTTWTLRILGVLLIAIIGGLIAAPISNMPFDPLFCVIYVPFAAFWTAIGAFARISRQKRANRSEPHA